MKTYFAYVRVSTVKQGERGSSLQEQRTAIEIHAKRHNLLISKWFEETETAAKKGRREFSRMLGELARGRAAGLIIHKIDRSARNLRDWADLGDLIDQGVDVQFAHDALNLQSRGGRLSADIQAVVAADYIRNLRDEVKKGFYGRLKQGLYPLPAPLGYLDRGGGKPKEIDPDKAGLVRQAFEQYATGMHSLNSLAAELDEKGLRTRRGQRLSANSVADLLHNPFYMGVIRIQRTNEVFEGVHKPLIDAETYDQVQALLRGKSGAKLSRHDFLFRRFVRCGKCGYLMTGERQKGRYIYYRCHKPDCRPTITSEAKLDSAVRQSLAALRCDDEEMRDIDCMIEEWQTKNEGEVKAQHTALRLKLSKFEEHLQRLMDGFLDGMIEKELFESQKARILHEKRSVLDQLAAPTPTPADSVRKYFELQNTAYFRYDRDALTERREILRAVTSNLSVAGKNPILTLKSPLHEVVNYRIQNLGGPSQGNFRTLPKKPNNSAKEIFEILKAAAIKAASEDTQNKKRAA